MFLSMRVDTIAEFNEQLRAMFMKLGLNSPESFKPLIEFATEYNCRFGLRRVNDELNREIKALLQVYDPASAAAEPASTAAAEPASAAAGPASAAAESASE
jgi:hypothetical protein